MGTLYDLALAIRARQDADTHDQAEAWAIAEGEPQIAAGLFFTRWRYGRTLGRRVVLGAQRQREADTCPWE